MKKVIQTLLNIVSPDVKLALTAYLLTKIDMVAFIGSLDEPAFAVVASAVQARKAKKG